ncbi:hypothetical protein [Salinarimonas ramus]|nr:hypothetical protein [Salinarimonas ramus]
MTGDTDSILRLLRDIDAALARAAWAEARADALFTVHLDRRAWGLAEDAETALAEARSARIAALLHRAEATALRVRLADPDGTILR